jgi:hypothetical protein
VHDFFGVDRADKAILDQAINHFAQRDAAISLGTLLQRA